MGGVPSVLSAPYHQREDVLITVNQPQLTNISDDEIEVRFQVCTARFCTSIDFTSRYVISYSDSIPTVIEAAQGNSLPIVDLLCEVEAEFSFWKSEPSEILSKPRLPVSP